jgi:hypothetical protein
MLAANDLGGPSGTRGGRRRVYRREWQGPECAFARRSTAATEFDPSQALQEVTQKLRVTGAAWEMVTVGLDMKPPAAA